MKQKLGYWAWTSDVPRSDAERPFLELMALIHMLLLFALYSINIWTSRVARDFGTVSTRAPILPKTPRLRATSYRARTLEINRAESGVNRQVNGSL